MHLIYLLFGVKKFYEEFSTQLAEACMRDMLCILFDFYLFFVMACFTELEIISAFMLRDLIAWLIWLIIIASNVDLVYEVACVQNCGRVVNMENGCVSVIL